MKPVVTFGEIMGRLAAPQHLRLRQTRELEVSYAGAEASVAASICNFGGTARYVTALPKHDLAEATMDSIRAIGVDSQIAYLIFRQHQRTAQLRLKRKGLVA